MSNLTILEHNDVLVVDSRLIAERLAIKHKNFLTTIEKYLSQIESSFGAVAFQTREFKTRQGNNSIERFAWLSEDQATFLMTLSRNTEQVVECKLALVKAFSKAKQVIKQVIPAQNQEIEKLKLELDLAKTQERLLATTNAIATLHGSEMLALMMGKPDAIVTRTERVETLVAVDGKGRAISSFDGVGITYLAKKYGFGKNTKACRYWLESIGVSDEQWIVEPTIVKSQKLSRDLLPKLDRQYAAKTGVRQQLLGE
jgi:anti-repressor protein